LGTTKDCQDGIVPKSIKYCCDSEYFEHFDFKVKIYEIIQNDEKDFVETNIGPGRRTVAGSNSKAHKINDYTGAMKLIWATIGSRRVGDNVVNTHSSRTHLVIEQKNFFKNESQPNIYYSK
jgi:hypothetical protein